MLEPISNNHCKLQNNFKKNRTFVGKERVRVLCRRLSGITITLRNQKRKREEIVKVINW